MLTQLLFVASLFFASLTGLSAQGTPPEQNGGVEQFVNGDFTQGDLNQPPPGWVITGVVRNTGGFDNQVPPQLNYANTSPYSASWDARTTITLSQELDIQEMGEVLTLTYWLKTVGDGNPESFRPQFSFNGAALEPLFTDPVPNTLPVNGFIKLMTTLITPQSGGGRGTLTITFQSITANRRYFLDDVVITGSLIIGDPQFIGLRGQSYQVHGVDGEVYNLVSSVNTQVNSKFVFLNAGECPIFNGIPAKNCWSHPGSYLGAIGVQQIVDGKVQQLSIVSGSAKQGFASVTLNGESFPVGSKIDGELFSINFISSHSIKVKTEEFSFTFENSDFFINQAVSARVPLSSVTAHGLFGQTHQSKVYNTAVKYIVGDVDDYVIADGGLFGKDFVYNQFQL